MTPAQEQFHSVAKKSIPWKVEQSPPLLKYNNVHTVCEESRCPNRHECSSLGIATFLIGGKHCTRACKFCHVATGKPLPLATLVEKERNDILNAARERKYDYLVITSVTRDDDEAGLAAHFASITRGLNAMGVRVELLIPDFHLRTEHLSVIAEAGPVVLAHNVETVRRLSPSIRPQANYERSLNLFRYLKKAYPKLIRKCALMVGLGETREEIEELIDDMKNAEVEIISVGQYLRPSSDEIEVQKFYTIKEFGDIEESIKKRNFLAYEVGPFVRSSYMARKTLGKVSAEILRRRDGF